MSWDIPCGAVMGHGFEYCVEDHLCGACEEITVLRSAARDFNALLLEASNELERSSKWQHLLAEKFIRFRSIYAEEVKDERVE